MYVRIIGTLIRHNTTTDQNEPNERPSVGVNAIVIETEWEEECTEELNSTQLHSVWWSHDTIIDQLKVAELIQRRQHVCRESFRIYQMQLVPMFCLCTDSTAPPPHWNQQCLGHGYYRHVHFITGQYIMQFPLYFLKVALTLGIRKLDNNADRVLLRISYYCGCTGNPYTLQFINWIPLGRS